MKAAAIACVLALAGLVNCIDAGAAGVGGTSEAIGAMRLRIATFNVRGIMKQDVGELHWEKRIPRIARAISSNGLDLVGLQECRHRMANAILAALPGYAGTGPALADSGEAHPGNVILYRTNVLSCAESRETWLSETPDVPFSSHPAASMPRTCVEAVFVGHATARRFRVVNVHLDHMSEEARVFGARTMLGRIVRPALARGEQVFLIGDLNERLDDKDTAESLASLTKPALMDMSSGNAAAMLLSDMDDTIALAGARRKGPFRSFRGWGRDVPKSRIDYILVAPEVTVLRHETIMDRYEGHFPSDHCPVMAEVEF